MGSYERYHGHEKVEITVITVIEIMCLRFTEISDGKGQCMAGTVHNATVCRVNDKLPVIVFCLKPPRKDISSSLPSFCVY